MQKILAQAGLASRRQAEQWIREGRVRVNGQVVTELGAKADPFTDRITVDRRRVVPVPELVYLAMHKPVGVVTTMSDPEGRPTVRNLLPKLPARVYPVGRLDYHSSGLLLFTNDGEVALRLTHPRYGVVKVYQVKVKGVPSEATLAKLRRGVRLEDGVAQVESARVLRSSGTKTWLEIAIREGRRREIRRLCHAVGHDVEKLKRVAIGPISLGRLEPGESRLLNEREVRALRRAVGLDT
ncbi:MAG: rRNA pseudouridine synthase [Candidatus Binatia bacterium]|nr:rRNA pseudouridine synthase [Candidatus Binatia bacterium]